MPLCWTVLCTIRGSAVDDGFGDWVHLGFWRLPVQRGELAPIGEALGDLDGPVKAFRVLAKAAHPDLADAVIVHPVCQEELYNPGRDVSINPNEDSILTSLAPCP